MVHQLSFAVIHTYDSQEQGITVPVTLTHAEDQVELLAKIDTGAQTCIFQRQYAEILQLDVEAGHHQTFETVTGTFEAFGHTVGLEVLGIRMDAVVFFARDHDFLRNVLGRHGWLQQIRMGLVDYNSLLYLSHYNDT